MKQTTTLLRRATSSLALIAMLCATLLLPLSSKAASPLAVKSVAPQVSVEVCRINPLPSATCGDPVTLPPAAGNPAKGSQVIDGCNVHVPATPACQTFELISQSSGPKSQQELVYFENSPAPGRFEFSLSSRLVADEKSPEVGILHYETHYAEDGQGTRIPRLSLSSSGKLELVAGTVETMKFPKLTVTIKRNQ